MAALFVLGLGVGAAAGLAVYGERNAHTIEEKIMAKPMSGAVQDSAWVAQQRARAQLQPMRIEDDSLFMFPLRHRPEEEESTARGL